MKTSTLVVIAIALSMVVGVLLFISESARTYRSAQSEQVEQLAPTTTSEDPVTSGGCAIGGCNGEICIEASEASTIVSSCVYLPEFACYKSARCERQGNGACDWTQTDELKACIAAAPKINVAPMSD